MSRSCRALKREGLAVRFHDRINWILLAGQRAQQKWSTLANPILLSKTGEDATSLGVEGMRESIRGLYRPQAAEKLIRILPWDTLFGTLPSGTRSGYSRQRCQSRLSGLILRPGAAPKATGTPWPPPLQ
jgi:hypothetical protein